MTRSIIMAITLSLFLTSCQTVSYENKVPEVSLIPSKTFYDSKQAKLAFDELNAREDKPFICRKESAVFTKDIGFDAPLDMLTLTKQGNSYSWNHQFEKYMKAVSTDAIFGYLYDSQPHLDNLRARMINWAKTDAWMDTTTNVGKCWKSGGKGFCGSHVIEQTSLVFNSLTHAYLLNWDYFENSAESELIKEYIARGNDKYVKARARDGIKFADRPNGGIYASLNQVSGMLFHAILVNDPDLFNDWKMKGIGVIGKYVEEEGFIYNNSYRGNRAVNYHSIGLEQIILFNEVLLQYGDSLHNYGDLGIRMNKAIDIALRAQNDYKWLEAKGPKGTNHKTGNSGAIRKYTPENANWVYGLKGTHLTDGSRKLLGEFQERTKYSSLQLAVHSGTILNCMMGPLVIKKLEGNTSFKQ